MRLPLTLLGGLAAAVLICASATMNFLFARTLGHSELDGLVLGVVSVALDLLKAVLAVFVARAAAEGRRAYVIVGGSVFCLITLVSLTASIGFTSNNRSAVTSGRESLNQELQLIEIRLRELRLQLAALPARRPTTILDEFLSASRQDRRWQGTKECSAASTQAGRTYCEEFFRLRAERATAIEAYRVSELIASGEQRALQLRKADAGGESDPQAKLLAASMGLNEAQVRRGLMALVAVVVEVISGLGIYLVTGHASERPVFKGAGKQPQSHEGTVAVSPAGVASGTMKPSKPDGNAASSRPHGQGSIGLTVQRREIT